ncbi:uncharacterized protein LOC109601365 isoform X2 [Aethina tumida]|uniref:uncharacterized protein LOC109601365 isoform X2 n=1 Tax=Aethina tumida TaxID=116153 RepID=UPI002147E49E|nr:uncharacterized protein LOC109601365 isoform X2 [Aethina tumida]
MAKKGPAQLQVEILTDEEWERFLAEREGLLVVDVYSDWCGPCAAMSAVLKKIKLEVGGDFLHLAMARSDEIPALERFRSKSEPTWMFISNGKLVNLMFGADAPALQRLVLAELKKEELFRQGIGDRPGIEPHERFGEEVARYEEEQSILKAIENREIAKKEKETLDRKKKECQNILEMMDNVGFAMIMPHAKLKYNDVLGDELAEAGLMIKEREKVQMTDFLLSEISFFCTEPPFPEVSLAEMEEDKCMALFLKPKPNTEISKIDRIIARVVFGEMERPPGSAGSPSQQLYKSADSGHMDEIHVEEKIEEVDKGELDDSEEEDEESKEIEEEEIVEVIIERSENDLIGIWIPPNERVKATCLKLFFTKYVSDCLIPIPEPEPDHLAIVYEFYKKEAVKKVMDQHAKHVMRYGFFTSEDFYSTRLVAKSFKKLNVKGVNRTYEEKLILQVSKKFSQCILDFAQVGPMYMSPNAEEGKKECRIVFGEQYDEPDLPDEEEHAVVTHAKEPEPVVEETHDVDDVDVEDIPEEVEGEEVPPPPATVHEAPPALEAVPVEEAPAPAPAPAPVETAPVEEAPPDEDEDDA